MQVAPSQTSEVHCVGAALSASCSEVSAGSMRRAHNKVGTLSEQQGHLAVRISGAAAVHSPADQRASAAVHSSRSRLTATGPQDGNRTQRRRRHRRRHYGPGGAALGAPVTVVADADALDAFALSSAVVWAPEVPFNAAVRQEAAGAEVAERFWPAQRGRREVTPLPLHFQPSCSGQSRRQKIKGTTNRRSRRSGSARSLAANARPLKAARLRRG